MISLYNILIVDDEEMICKGLKSMIERSSIEDIGEVSFTYYPESVQQIVKEKKIDIIITDIRMPVMTGLDLIREVSKDNPSMKFIVLSGYDDFEFVKKAFKLGAFDYLLKPGSIDELKSIIEKIIGTINEEEKNKLRQQSNTHKYINAVLENRLNKIFSGNRVKEENIEDLFKELNINFSYPYFTVGVLSFYNKIGESKNFEIVSFCLEKVAKVFKESREVVVMYFQGFNNNLVFIFNHTKAITTEKLNSYMEMLIKQLKECDEGNYFGSLSNSQGDIKSVGMCFEEAMEALAYKILYDPNKVIKYADITNKEDLSDKYSNKLDNLKEYISSYNTVAVSDLIDTLFNREGVKKLSTKSLKKLYKKAVNIIEGIVMDNEVVLINREVREYASFSQLSDLKIYLKTLAFELITILKEHAADRSISDIVKKYVQENYYKDIDMAVVSNMVSLSYSHFSKIFKDETGMNFSDYLQKVRMEKALEMLGDPTNKVHDIAQGIGYNNPKHFTRAFKNYFGFSPSEYRGNA